MKTLDDAFIPELPNHSRGKVRDNYDLPDGRRIIIATDRLSAFDRSICLIPDKGYILTQIARFWFERTKHLMPNHALDYPDPNVIVAKRLRMIPVEIIVRDYLAGTTDTSILQMYKRGERHMYGLHFAEGLRDYERLPNTIITPTSKDDNHDKPLSASEVIDTGLVTADQWDRIEQMALDLFKIGREVAMQHDLILADTKYEFGLDAYANIILADEVHTPDSSRLWRAESYEGALNRGDSPPSLDKDVLRHWLRKQCDPYAVSVLPKIPRQLVECTSDIYAVFCESLTGEILPILAEPIPILDRIKSNLRRVGILPT